MELENELKTKKFVPVDGTYDYLLNIKTYQYTMEAVNSLVEEVEKLRVDTDALKVTTVVDMWKSDILKC